MSAAATVKGSRLPKLCFDVMTDAGCKGHCGHFHPADVEVAKVEYGKKAAENGQPTRSICAYALRGSCKNSNKCTFLHITGAIAVPVQPSTPATDASVSPASAELPAQLASVQTTEPSLMTAFAGLMRVPAPSQATNECRLLLEALTEFADIEKGISARLAGGDESVSTFAHTMKMSDDTFSERLRALKVEVLQGVKCMRPCLDAK
jgi:hypothetical protein